MPLVVFGDRRQRGRFFFFFLPADKCNNPPEPQGLEHLIAVMKQNL